MPVPEQITVSAEKAARLLDLKPAEFRAAVEAGYLPPGREIVPGKVRWLVETLRAIACADAVAPHEGFDI